MENPKTESRMEAAHEKFAEDLRSTAQAAGNESDVGADQLARSRQDFQIAFDAAKDLAQCVAGELQQQLGVAARATDDAIRKHPYTAVGTALGLGLLVGYLIKRK